MFQFINFVPENRLNNITLNNLQQLFHILHKVNSQTDKETGDKTNLIKELDLFVIMTSSMFVVNNHAFNHKREMFDKKISKWQIKEKRFMQTLSETTELFCLNTTLHGLRNIFESISEYQHCKTRGQRCGKILSTIVWLTFLILGLIFATILIRYFWQRFQSTPTITTIETNNHPIWNVDFPAVTICNVNKVYKPATTNISEQLSFRGIPNDQIDYFLGNLSKLVQPEYTTDIFNYIHQILDELGYNTESLMKELMQPCDELLDKCVWLGKFIPCKTLFRTAKSVEGYCCSFNYDGIKDNLEIDGEKISEDIRHPKYRVSGAGPYVGMELLVNIQPEHYVAYTKTYYGVSILIHSPNQYPQNAVAKTIGQIGTDVTINVVPSVVVSDISVKKLSLAQRNCYFEDEVKLRTSNVYTFQTCTNECAVDTIFKICKCIPFYYVEAQMITDTSKRRDCTLRDVNCLREHRHIFSSLQPNSVLNETIGLNCSKCIPSCSEVRYDIQANVAQRLSDAQLRSLRFDDSITLTDYVTLKIHFKDITCLKYRRNVFLTWDSMFASCGGIYSLCLGGSVISIIELIWYYTVKLYSISKQPPKDKQRRSLRNRHSATVANEVNIFKISTKDRNDRRRFKIKQIEGVK